MAESWCTALADACVGFASAMEILGKPGNAVWFRRAAGFYRRGWCPLGRFCKWVAGWDLYRSDWQDVLLLHEYGKLSGVAANDE